MAEFFVYILETTRGTYYVGYTNDIKKRMKAHQEGKGAKFVRAFGFAKLLYQERHTSKSSALKREAEIKRWSRLQKKKLILSVCS